MSVTPVPVPTLIKPTQASQNGNGGTSPRDWLKRLEAKLTAQQAEVAMYEAYFKGDHPLRFATDKFKQVFGNLFGAFSDNWCELIVLASVERLEVTGFRHGDSETADKDLWKVWQENDLDNGSVLAHTEAVKLGKGYVIVNSDGAMAVEHPSQVIVAHVAGNRRQRLAALKKWVDDDGYIRANVYLPSRVVKFRSRNKQGSNTDVVTTNDTANENGWRELSNEAHGFDTVPVIPLYNNPGMLCDGVSDLRVAIPLTNAINKQVLDMMIASEFAAYPQRVLTGVELPKDPVTNQVLESAQLKAAVSRLWNFEGKDAKVESLTAADLNNYVKPIEMLIQHLAAQTRTPPHYLLSSIINASGDALKAAEAGLVSKVEKKILDFSDGWEEAMRLSAKVRRDARTAKATDLETIWADPEKKSEAEKVDAAMKLLAIDVPHKIAWKRAGLTPKEIEEAEKALPETLKNKAARAPVSPGQTAPPENATSDPQETP